MQRRWRRQFNLLQCWWRALDNKTPTVVVVVKRVTGVVAMTKTAMTTGPGNRKTRWFGRGCWKETAKS